MNVILLLIFAFLVYILWKNNTIFPFSFIFSLFWFLNIFSSEIFFSDVSFSQNIYVFLLGACIMTSLGELIFGSKKMPNGIGVVFESTIKKRFFYVFLAIGMVYPVEILYINGLSLDVFLSFDSILEANTTLAESRYDEQSKTSILSQLTLIFLYLTPLWGGMVFKNEKKFKFFLLSILPSLIVLLTQNTKFVFVVGLSLFFVGRLTYILLFEGELPKLKMKALVNYLLMFFLIYSLIIVSFVFRTGNFTESSFKYANVKFAEYVSYVPAFDMWLVEDYNSDSFLEFQYGVKTFYGIANAIGIQKREIGVFNDFKRIETNKEEVITNVYTVFRFHIEDFGILGTYCFLFFISSIFAFFRSNQRELPLLSIVVVASLLFYIFDSYVSSIWAYASFILLFVVFYFALKVSCKKVSNDQF
ncbi:hypothetical protein BWK63_08670 [Flavobacterium covae]|uniref:O-antigen polymerase n=1 Tax=Flavobacterium covae TaxID=2906076 RepID=A0ABW8PI89_9FLAO|nr:MULTISPECIES: O-antigen polymerase [Flavobacterium]OWP80885.1 hypothetical protein BWK63_08670 [Flavobacterium covae]POR22827.1 hypothetical protein BWK57_04505 [Flavobacterium columnare]